MKRLLSMVFAFAVLFCSFPVAYATEEPEANDESTLSVSTLEELQAAIAVAEDGDEIQVLKSIIFESGEYCVGDSTKHIELRYDYYSGGSDLFVINPTATKITLQNISIVGNGHEYETVLRTSSKKQQILLSNVLIQGLSCLSYPICNTGTMEISNCTFRNNYGIFAGHIKNEKGTLTVSGSTFVGGKSGGYGGAIYNLATLMVSDSIFENNYANYGGAIYSSGNCEITNSRITNNTARYSSGGISNTGIITNSMVITDCEIYGNTASEWSDDISNETNITIQYTKSISDIYSTTDRIPHGWQSDNSGNRKGITDTIEYDIPIISTKAVDGHLCLRFAFEDEIEEDNTNDTAPTTPEDVPPEPSKPENNEPTTPIEPEVSEPTEPSEPEVTEPITPSEPDIPNTTLPSEPESTEPAQGENTPAETEPEGTEPTETPPTESIPDETDPTEGSTLPTETPNAPLPEEPNETEGTEPTIPEETESPTTSTDEPTVPEQGDNLPVIPDSTKPTLPPVEGTEGTTPTVPNDPEDAPSTPPEASETPPNSPNEDIVPTEPEDTEDTPPTVQEGTEYNPTMPDNTEPNNPSEEEQGSMIETEPENEPLEDTDTTQKATNGFTGSEKDEKPEENASSTPPPNEPGMSPATESILLEEHTENNKLNVTSAYSGTTPMETNRSEGNILTRPEGAEASQAGNREDGNNMSIVILVSILLALEVIQLGCIAIFLFAFLRSENIRKVFKHKYQR